ncbi:gliding motility-associated-like protein/uncharacterized repeat protein (TIGR01451 family) [Pedobacter sp. AK017]|uniref:T9SS type B sorting domain-containing protein n=1 Tax=Pedobacter sp. AK017 TaxID=2723073 RepID=UPI00161DCBFB|nr:gliding motility-associated C-terminal domain-containing protein [Pedobacter sp. AK017]MBB5438121.1 gliding motility-associated-like protein/uncharacterized repeat protein (TIGR01451 family) [Pedobacter sp. AK017]
MIQFYLRSLLACLVLLLFGSQLQAANYYWVGGSGNWSEVNLHWSSTSGGVPDRSIVPGTGDDVYFDANSGLDASSVIILPTSGNALCRNMSWVGVTAAATFRANGSGTTLQLQIYGNLELSSAVKYGMVNVRFMGSSNATYKINGAQRLSINWYNQLLVEKTGGSLKLLDGIPANFGIGLITLESGGLDLSGNTHEINRFTNGAVGNTRTLNLTNSTLNAAVEFFLNATNSTLLATGSTLITGLFTSNGLTFSKVEVTGTSGGPTILNTTFDELLFSNPNSVTGSVRIGAGNQVGRLEFKGGGRIESGNNIIGKLILAPSKGYIFRESITVNELFQFNTPDCDALGQLTGGPSISLNLATGAVADVQNVFLTNMVITGNGTPLTVQGADGGGNTGFNIQPRATGTTLYWVGGAGNWDDKDHWSSSSGGTGGACVPFTGDNVIFDANSGFTAVSKTVTVAGAAWCHNMTWTNVANAPVFDTGTNILEVYGNIELDPGLSISGILLAAGSEPATFTTKGANLGKLSFRIYKAPGVALTVTDDINFPELSIVHSRGGLLMGNRNINIFALTSTGNGRIVDISNSTITVTDNWTVGATNSTWVNNAAGSFVTSNRVFSTNGFTYPKVHITTNLNVVNITGTTIDELVFTDTSPSSLVVALNGAGNNTIGTLDVRSGGVTFMGNNTINNLFLTPSRTYYFRNTQTVNGLFRFNSPGCEGLGELRGVEGFAPTLNFGPSSTRDFDNAYVQNMTATGSGVPISIVGADAGGNSGFVFTSSTAGARYWVGGDGDWNESAHWSTTSGGAGGACVPTVANDVFFDANSFTPGSKAVTINQGNAYCRNMDWTGAVNGATFFKNASFTLEIWGNMVLNSGVTSTAKVNFMGPANASLTPNNASLGALSMEIIKPGSKLTFLGDYNNVSSSILLTSGGLDLSGRTITASFVYDNTSAQPLNIDIRNATINARWHFMGANKVLQLAGSKITAGAFRSNAGVYNIVDVTVATAGDISISNTTFTDLLFSNAASASQANIGANNTIGRLEFKGKGTINGSGNTIETLIFFPGKMYTFLSGSTNTITKDWFGSGTPCNLTEINSSAAGAFTVNKTTGGVELDYVRLRNITAVGNTANPQFQALEHSEDLGGNTNWSILPYNNSTPILGLGSDKTVFAAEFPYTINTEGFFASPLAIFAWGDGSTGKALVVNGPGTYSVTVSYPDGCSRSDEIVISQAAVDLAIVKTANNMTPAVGSDVVFTLAATNNGPQQSTGISVTDLLAVGYTFKSAAPPAGTTYDASTGVWTIGTLASGASSTLTVTAIVNAAGPYVNTATITGPEVDPVPGNNSSSITPVPVPTADVAVTKTVDNGNPLVGSNVVFTLAVNNAGPSSATNVALTDLLPDGYTYVSAVAPAGTTYDPLTGLWTIGTLANGANASATITATVKATGTYANTASVTLTENDPVSANNTATVTPVPVPQANLSVVKTINNAAPYAGNNVIFTITAANAGPSPATGVQVNDLLPSGYTFVSATPSQGAYNPSTGIWTMGTLANAANATLTITATVKDAGVYANTATITSTEADPVMTNNSSTVTPTPIVIKITKTGPATVNAGALVQYVLSVKNTGTGNALAAVIADAVPAELTNVSWTTVLQGTATISSGATGTGNNVSVTGNIPAGTASQIDITVSGTIPAASSASSISNTATVTASGSPVISSNTVITAIGRAVDLHVQKTGPASVVAGSAVVYTLQVTNTGPSDASNVAIADNIPAGLNNVTWTAVAQNGAVINGAATGTGNVNLSGFIPAGTASISVNITGTLDASYAGATLVNTATATPSSGVTDPTPASSTVTSTVSRTANIRIVKSGPGSIGAGEDIAYILQITNDGPSNASGIEIKDDIPVEVENPTWTATVPSGATLSASAGTGDIDLVGSIPAGTGLIEILVKGKAGTTFTDGSTFINTATANLPAGSPVTDPEPASNTSTISTLYTNTPNIRVSKNGPATVNIGDPITYTIVITNGGGGNVTGAVIQDIVPASVTVTGWDIVAAGTAQVTGDPSGTTNNVNTAGDIPADPAASLTLTIQGTVNATAVPTFTNTVTVTVGAIGESSVTTAVNQSKDIVVEKNGPQAVIAGRPIFYTVKLSNAGPQNAQGLILNDVIPAEVENVTWSAATFGTASINGTFTGTTNAIMVKADVAAGAGNYVLITVNGTVSPSTPPSTITNTASVTLPIPSQDFNLTNNTSEVNTQVSRETNLAITKAVDNVAPDAGSNVVFTLAATNNGPSNASGVIVTDPLPAGYTYVSSNAPLGTSYDPGTGVWTIGTLANAASSALTITATVNAAGPYANTATISGTEPDPIMANNTATVTPVPVPLSDLMITKTADKLTPDAGSTIVFTLGATNNGPSAATGVSVTDLLPAGYSYVSSTPAAGTTYDPVTGVWMIGTLANGANSGLTITARVNAAGPYANTASIIGTETDPETTNNTATVTPVPAAVTDLSITKTADNLSPNVGGNIVFSLVASNNGPSPATGVSVTDLLPAGYTYVSSTAPGTSYTPATGIWTIGTLANSATATLTITAKVNAAGPYANTASITGTETDPETTNNTATVTPVPAAVTDLAISKTADNLSPNTGGNIVFSLIATNNGPSTATGVSVADLLPAGYSYVSSVPAAGTSYDPLTGAWTIGTLANAASSTLTVTATVNAAGSYVNTAVISGTEADLIAANNTSAVTPVPVPVTDLQVTKTADQMNPVMGSNVVFTIVAANNGPSGATGLKVTDQLPTGYAYVSSAPAAGTSYDAATGVWTIGALANAASSTLTITARVNVTGLYANSAVISGAETDLVAANNISGVTPVPVPLTDLMVVKTADQPSAPVGSNVTFSIVASNNGPSEATAVVVNDLLTSGYTYVSSVAEPGTSYDELTGVWSIGSLANGANATLTVTATINASGDYTNSATISGAEDDPATANNTATATPFAEPVTDLLVNMTASDLAPVTGSNMSFEITASNIGPSGATGITVTDLLPAGYTYVSSAAPSGSTYNPATGVWTIATLSATESMTLSITARVNAAGPYANTAIIAGTESDPVPANNTASVTPVPVPVTDLAIVKTTDQASPAVGTNVVFTLVATNNGPSPATGIAVTDLLPGGYTYVSATAPAGSTYVPATGLWTIGALANGASSTLSVTARVNATGPYANTAIIAGTESDPVPANNTTTVTPVPSPVTDLAIVKTADQASPAVGSNVVFTLVATNNGPSPATGVTVTDLLPAGYTYISATAPAGSTYVPATGLWTIRALANAASSTLTITARVNAAGPYANTATITGTENDLVPANNTATVSPVPQAVTDLAIVKTADQASPAVGTNVVFTLVATNNGPSPATGVAVTDLLPAGYTYISATAPAGSTYVQATGLWSIGALANGASSTLTITARVNATGPYANTATISGAQQDLVAANNASTVTPGPQTRADLVTVKTLKDPAQTSVVPGQAVTYVIKVTNNGPSSALSVNIRDAAPAGTTISRWTTVPAAGVAYPNASGTGDLNETIAVLDNGLTATYEVTVQTPVSLSGNLTNTVQVSSPTSDPNPGCTSCTQVLTVLSPPNTAPTLAVIADQQVCYASAGQTIALTGITAGNEQNQTVTLSVSSNNPDLFSSLEVTPLSSGNASLNYTINNSAGGTALITVTVKDNGGTLHGGSDTFSRSFTLVAAPLPQLHIAADPGTSVSKGQTIALGASGASSYSWANAAGILGGQNSATLTVRPAQTTTYTVTGTSAAGCISTQEITITVIEDYNLVANNVLTPNGDGKNDFFTVKNIDMYPNNEVRIFDRAGRSVYSKRGYNNEWDGTLNGSPLDEDTYYYIIDFGNGVKAKKGFISIVRKY